MFVRLSLFLLCLANIETLKISNYKMTVIPDNKVNSGGLITSNIASEYKKCFGFNIQIFIF